MRYSKDAIKAIHKALEAKYKGHGIDEQQQIICEHYSKHPVGSDWRSSTFACQVIEKYNEYYAADRFKVIMTETPFKFPLFGLDLPSYCGRVDLVTEEDNRQFIWDHKTSSVLKGSYFDQFALSRQMMGYKLLAREAGYKPDGVIVNAIGIERPSKRNVEPVIIFQRQTLFYSEEQLIEWQGDTKNLVEGIVQARRNGVYSMQRENCVSKYGRCQYFDVCTQPVAFREAILASDIYDVNEFDPLKTE